MPVETENKYTVVVQSRRHFCFFIFLILVLALTNTGCKEEKVFDPVSIFLTWQYDPTTTMTIDWHTTPGDGNRSSLLQFRKLGSDQWSERVGAAHDFPHSDRKIHRITLRRLEPGTMYEFRFGNDSKTYRFKTISADLTEPLCFAAGGDTGHEEEFTMMNRTVMKYGIDFVVLGGDIAYCNGEPGRVNRWYEWFDGVKEGLIDADGRVIPMVIGIGNHELFSESRLYRGTYPHNETEHTEETVEAFMNKYNLWENKATFFFDLFAFPGRPAYNLLDFGDYMSLFILDTNHYSAIAGGQTGWLEASLAERQNRPHLFPVYHVPAYPSHRSYEGETSVDVRENWVPLFEKYGVRVAFENHDHTYKRTHSIKNGEVVNDGEGIVYMGDGSWVAGPRSGDNKEAWYINQFASVNHGIIVTLYGDGTQEYVMVSVDGEEFDSYTVGGRQ